MVAALNEAIDRREEGLIVKQPASTYCPDKRKGQLAQELEVVALVSVLHSEEQASSCLVPRPSSVNGAGSGRRAPILGNVVW